MPRTLASLLVCFVLVFVSVSPAAAEESKQRAAGPWNMESLAEAPKATWGEKVGLVQEVYYEGEPLNGKPTRVFAYYARPAAGDGPFPGMVLVHGGGGTAFAEWATLWAERGYAAVAMDLAGCGPERKRLPDGGPNQGHHEKFAPFADDQVETMWTYHAVAAVVRGHSLLAAREEVDANRIGITGISWGGYLTCIVTGVDHRLKVSVPVYGCGFLHHNSAWLGILEKMSAEERSRWIRYFDPSQYVPGVACPILFVNGTNDFAYPLDSHLKTCRQVPGRADLRIEVRMKHSHQHGWAPREIGRFVDSVLLGGDPLPQLAPMQTNGRRASAAYSRVANAPVVKGELHYTLDTGPWDKRNWQTVEAVLRDDTVSADLPEGRPLVYFLSVTDRQGGMVSTEHASLR